MNDLAGKRKLKFKSTVIKANKILQIRAWKILGVGRELSKVSVKMELNTRGLVAREVPKPSPLPRFSLWRD